MKTVRIKTGKKGYKTDMFTVLCLAQSAAVVLIVIMIFAVSRISPNAFYGIKGEIEEMFRKNYDIGGYFTPTEEKEFSVSGDTSVLSQMSFTEEAGISDGSEPLVFCAVTENVSDNIEFYSAEAVMPVNGQVTSPYGYRIHPIYGTDNFHAGRDIAAPEGSAVYAVLDGTVMAAGTASSAGNYVKIDHGNNKVTLYCHCSKLYVKKGDSVRKGDIIAAVGQTGLATGPHLHFEYHLNGNIEDPEKILGGAVNVY